MRIRCDLLYANITVIASSDGIINVNLQCLQGQIENKKTFASLRMTSKPRYVNPGKAKAVTLRYFTALAASQISFTQVS